MHILKIATLIAAGAAAAVTIPAASARSSGWPVIASSTIDGRSDSDDLYLPGRQNVRAIKLCVAKAALNLREVRVYFRNGAKQDVAMRQRLAPGSCTLRIDLKGYGRDRDITRIRLKHDRGDRGDRNPIVEVTGH